MSCCSSEFIQIGTLTCETPFARQASHHHQCDDQHQQRRSDRNADNRTDIQAAGRRRLRRTDAHRVRLLTELVRSAQHILLGRVLQRQRINGERHIVDTVALVLRLVRRVAFQLLALGNHQTVNGPFGARARIRMDADVDEGRQSLDDAEHADLRLRLRLVCERIIGMI